MPRRNRRKIYRQEKEGFRFDPRKYINKGFDKSETTFCNVITTDNHWDVVKTHPNIQLIRIYEGMPSEYHKKCNPNVRKRRAVKAIYDMQRSAVLMLEMMKEMQEEGGYRGESTPLKPSTADAPDMHDAPHKHSETTKIQRFIAAVTALTRKYTHFAENTLAAKTSDQ